jgi:hypothetical protein
MPINTTQVYVKNLLNGLAWPFTGVPALACQITPPDPNVEANIPQGYVWPSRGKENRDPRRGGTIPRATGPNSPSGLKTQTHRLDVYLVWWGQDDDPDSDTLFPGMVDWVMETLRLAPDTTPVLLDPWTNRESYLIDIGEDMNYELTVRAVADERFNRYDALITCVISEVFAA